MARVVVILNTATERRGMAWKYYVYEVERDGRVVYVGKGCGRRLSVSARARDGRASIVAYFKHEEFALQFERRRIAERLREGCRLENIASGNAIAWWKRTDTKQMATEVLEWVAARVGRWIKAGKVDELSRILKMPSDELIALHQRFGR